MRKRISAIACSITMLAALVIIAPQSARAEDGYFSAVPSSWFGGTLNYSAWNSAIGNIPTSPWITPPAGATCATGLASNINYSWGNGNVFGTCNDNYVVVKFYGTITSPVSAIVDFCNISDDGFYLILGGTPVTSSDWTVHGAGFCFAGTNHGKYIFSAGDPVQFEAWYFENDGAAEVRLYSKELTLPEVMTETHGCGALDPLVCPIIIPTVSAPNAFATAPNEIFMTDLHGITIGDTIHLRSVGHDVIVLGITPTSFYPRVPNVFDYPVIGTEGYLLRLNFEQTYTWWTRDFVSLTQDLPPVVSVIGAPGWGLDYESGRATYRWLRCNSGGEANQSARMPHGCRVIRGGGRGARLSMVSRPHQISSSDRSSGYLRLAVTVGHTTYYSGAYDLNQ